ncbi:MAG: TIGR03905 family TSCPD domain-containing protein [Firmicutes bacterium]|nr:TIGR03905 family TSCPD domain-containing protein [Bacillota bacterium]
MGKFSFTPRGVCSSQIDFEITDGIVHNVRFTRGCNGNTQGIGKLVEGMSADEVIKRLKGVDCAGRGTSCPDQLAMALELAIKQTN